MLWRDIKMLTLDEVLRSIYKDEEPIYEEIIIPTSFIPIEQQVKHGITNDLKTYTVTINYRDTELPSCWDHFLYLKDWYHMPFIDDEDEKELKIFDMLNDCIKVWCDLFRRFNKRIHLDYSPLEYSKFLAINRFCDEVDSVYDFKKRVEKIRKQIKGESKMKKKDQKDLLIFVKGIIEEVIDGIDVDDRNGKELYSLANQTKEEIEKGMNTMVEFGNAYEELHNNLKEDYLIRTTADKLKRTLLDTYKKKNADYGDSFAESVDWFGYEAAYVRIYDKIMRCNSLTKKDPQVVSESKADTLMDLANYCVMFYAILDGSEYAEALEYIINEFKDNSFAVEDTIMYRDDKPVGRIPSLHYIATEEWKESVEEWSVDMPELKDEVFKLAVSAIRVIVFEEVGVNVGK